MKAVSVSQRLHPLHSGFRTCQDLFIKAPTSLFAGLSLLFEGFFI